MPTARDSEAVCRRRVGHSLQSGLTIHSSRSRFAARLNSGVELNRYAVASVLTLLYAYHGDLNCRMDAAAYRVTAHVRATSRHW